MIILNSKKINSNSFKSMLNYYNNSINNGFLECPGCKSTNLIQWGSYTRTCIYIEDGKLMSEDLTVKRVKCKDCGKTHALLPSFIVPYKQYLLDISLCCVGDKEISYKYNFSFDTIIKWKVIFKKYLPYLITTFNTTKERIVDYLLDNIMEAYRKFYECNNLILMLSHKAIYNMAYF